MQACFSWQKVCSAHGSYTANIIATRLFVSFAVTLAKHASCFFRVFFFFRAEQTVCVISSSAVPRTARAWLAAAVVRLFRLV